MDGSYLNLPDTAEARHEFSVQTNQHPGAEQVQALASVLYDLRNDLGLSARWGRSKLGKPPWLRRIWRLRGEGMSSCVTGPMPTIV